MKRSCGIWLIRHHRNGGNSGCHPETSSGQDLIGSRRYEWSDGAHNDWRRTRLVLSDKILGNIDVALVQLRRTDLLTAEVVAPRKHASVSAVAVPPGKSVKYRQRLHILFSSRVCSSIPPNRGFRMLLVIEKSFHARRSDVVHLIHSIS